MQKSYVGSNSSTRVLFSLKTIIEHLLNFKESMVFRNINMIFEVIETALGSLLELPVVRVSSRIIRITLFCGWLWVSFEKSTTVNFLSYDFQFIKISFSHWFCNLNEMNNKAAFTTIRRRAPDLVSDQAYRGSVQRRLLVTTISPRPTI